MSNRSNNLSTVPPADEIPYYLTPGLDPEEARSQATMSQPSYHTPPVIPRPTPQYQPITDFDYEAWLEASRLTPPPRPSEPAKVATSFNWAGVARMSVILLDAGMSIYDAIQISRQKSGYLPPDDYMIRQIKARHPEWSDAEIRGAMLQAKTRPKYIAEPPWLAQRMSGSSGIPSWGWALIAGGAVLLITKGGLL